MKHPGFSFIGLAMLALLPLSGRAAPPGEATASAPAAPATPASSPAAPPGDLAPRDAPMVEVPAGSALLGSGPADREALPREKPQRQVTLAAFWIDRYEVTNSRYAQCVQAGKCAPAHRRGVDRPGYYADTDAPLQPVVGVTFKDASDYCAWVGRRLNGQGALPTTALMPLAMAAVPDAPKGLAWWTRNPWDGGAGAARDWRHEFGVRMFTLYDPDAVYGAGTACGELASAWSPKIGFWIVVPAETVAAERLHRLRAELKPAGQPAAAVTTKGMP